MFRYHRKNGDRDLARKFMHVSTSGITIVLSPDLSKASTTDGPTQAVEVSLLKEKRTLEQSISRATLPIPIAVG
jgi:hypothetical protein